MFIKNTIVIFLTALFCDQIVITSTYQERLKIDHLRAESIALEKILWDEIQHHKHFSKTEIRHQIFQKIIKYHNKFIEFDKTQFIQQKSSEYFSILHEFKQWNEIEERTVLVENKFHQFQKLLINTRGKEDNNFLEKFQKFSVNVIGNWNSLLKVITYKPDQCFYGILRYVSWKKKIIRYFTDKN